MVSGIFFELDATDNAVANLLVLGTSLVLPLGGVPDLYSRGGSVRITSLSLLPASRV